VVYQKGSGWCEDCYILSGPNSDESIHLLLETHGLKLRDESGENSVLTHSDESHEDRVFALASVLLREMGWAD
jgi:hypothetical protein